MEKVNDILSKQRYIASNTKITEADIRLFSTLLRFDEVYVVYFKTNKKCVREYEDIQNYLREIYQLKGLAPTVNMDHIKTHYFCSHNTLNWYAIVPKGSNTEDDLKKPHNRDRFN